MSYHKQLHYIVVQTKTNRWVLSPPEYTMSGCDTFESSRIPDGIVLFPVSSISVRSNHNVKYLSPCTQWDDINIFSKPIQERTWKKTMVSVFNSTGVCLFGPHQFEWAFTSPPQSNSIMEEKAFALVGKYLLQKNIAKNYVTTPPCLSTQIWWMTMSYFLDVAFIL